MKLFIVVILFAVCGSAMCGKAEFEENAKECAQKNNIDRDSIKKYFMEGQASASPELKCYFLCVSEKLNIIKDGALNPQGVAENFANYASKDEIAKMTSECNLKGTDNCDTGFKVATCIHKIKSLK